VKYILIKKKILYDYRNRETSDENRKYSNIKFMLKEWMKDEVHDEANKLVENYSQQLWEKKYFIIFFKCFTNNNKVCKMIN